MSYQDVPVDKVKIKNFIFHIVHHGADEPVLMDDTPIIGFETFFKKRIIEVLDGNKFYFNSDSTFLKEIQKLKDDNNAFVEVSKDLAKLFHVHQDNRVKAGVMILIQADIAGNERFIFIKYDHEEVIHYTYKDNKAILEEISNTFSKSKDALQKSVVIDLGLDLVYGVVIDKSERQHVTQFFKNYLGIKRHYDEKDLTQKVKNCYFQTVKQFKSELPKEYTSQLESNFFNIVQNAENFESEIFIQKIIGSYYKPEMLSFFQKELKKSNISGEEFKLNKNIPKPRQKKFRTFEGVSIQFFQDANDTVKIEDRDQETIITITTKQLLEE